MQSVPGFRVQTFQCTALVCCITGFWSGGISADTLLPETLDTARYALRYEAGVIDTLEDLVAFKTVAVQGIPPEQNPEHKALKSYVQTMASTFGLDYADHGALVIVGLGQGPKRLGIVTHGDVQPADATKWANDPFMLDRTSEPGRLVARGTEDDKASIATALFAMRSLQEQQVPLKRRIELMIYLAEESDWTPLQEYIAAHEMPDLNVTIDANYPVVMAEKGAGAIEVTIARSLPSAMATNSPTAAVLTITRFSGGVFASQIPEDALASVSGPAQELADLRGMLEETAAGQSGMHYDFILDEGVLNIKAAGLSAHSSTPEAGVNAVQFLAGLLGITSEKVGFAPSPALSAVQFLHELVGTGSYAEQFGELAYSHPFMGPMTLAATVVREAAEGIRITLNTRRPVGKTAEQLQAQTRVAITDWEDAHGVQLESASRFGEPMLIDSAPHVGKLLDVFSHFTGVADPAPLSIGGSTNAKLLPNAVSFGPSMPGAIYTGHSEHEFVTQEQMRLNLQMVTAMMIEAGNLE